MVLVVPVMPAHGGNGLAMRAGLLAEGLAGLGPLRILVVPAFGDPGPPSELVMGLGAEVEVLDATADPAAHFRERLASPEHRARAAELHPKPGLCAAASLAASRRLAEIAGSARGVVVMRTYLAPMLDAILESPGRPPVILDVDDIESESLHSTGDEEQAARFGVLEDHYLPKVDLLLACSEADARALETRHGSRVAVVPNAIRPPERIEPAPGPGEGYDLLLVGNLAYDPNAEAARWLCEEVLPMLDDARLAIVGSNPGREVLELAGDRVVVAADVHDVGEWHARSIAGVAPLRSGGGTKIKVIEALAHGRPVVATPQAARGFDEIAGGEDRPVVVADSAAAFARRCAALLADPEAAARRGLAGREWVLVNASVPVVAELIARLAGGIFSA